MQAKRQSIVKVVLHKAFVPNQLRGCDIQFMLCYMTDGPALLGLH